MGNTEPIDTNEEYKPKFQEGKEKKSYYDINRKGVEYISNEKNLKKIRSKNLRQFCKFYENIKLLPYLQILSGNEIIPTEELLKNKRGAGKNLIFNQMKELKAAGISQELFKSVRWGFSERTIYDYMNAFKYLNAVDNSKEDLGQEIIGLIGKSHNATKEVSE